MPHKTRSFAMSLAVFLLLAAASPTRATAWPLNKLLHLHPHTQQDARITVFLFNKGQRFQEISVAGRVYTVMPHDSVTIKAPAGTDIFAETSTVYHRKGELLFSVSPERSRKTFPID